MCPGGVWSVSGCPHPACKCSSLSFDVRTCSLSTNVLSDCDGTINVFHILCKPEWQWKRALFHFRSYFAKFAVVILTLDCRVGNATCNRRWFTFCGKFMCFAFLMFLCVHQVFIQFVHINDLIEDNRGNARDCAHPHGVCACGKVCFVSYFSCWQAFVKSLTVSNGLVKCRALKCI